MDCLRYEPTVCYSKQLQEYDRMLTLCYYSERLQLVLDFIDSFNTGIHVSHLQEFKWLIHCKRTMLDNALCIQWYIYIQTKLYLTFLYVLEWI